MTPAPLLESLPLDPRLKELLANAARQPGDAYLFAGPRGAGKLGAARAFAAAVVCPDACGECSCCSRAMRGIHPDLSWFEPEGFTYPIESLREMAAAGAQSPIESRRRVLLVEQAGLMAERSQNALLKALEEPAPSLTWVLVADSLEPFLPTILSRCTLVEFAPVPEDVMRTSLASSAQLSADEVDSIVLAARGDLDAAMALATDELAREVREAALAAVRCPLPDPGWAIETAAGVLAMAGRARARKEEELARAEAEAGAGRRGGARRAGDRTRRVLRRAELELMGDFVYWLAGALRDRAAEVMESSPGAAGPWLGMVDEALAAHAALRENANPGLLLESLLLGVAAADAG